MIITTTEEAKKVQAYLKEAAQSLHRVEQEKQAFADILNVLKEEFNISQKQSRAAIKHMTRGDFPIAREQFEELEALVTVGYQGVLPLGD